jgi:hypothetical protein
MGAEPPSDEAAVADPSAACGVLSSSPVSLSASNVPEIADYLPVIEQIKA